MTTPTTAPLSNGSGSLNGIACQFNLPSMSTSRLTHWRTPGPADRHVSGTRRRLVQDALEQLRFHRAISCERYVSARLCQLGVAGIVQAGSSAARLLEPGVEIAGGHRLDDEPHPGEAVTAEICREAGKLARIVCQKAEMRSHAAHR